MPRSDPLRDTEDFAAMRDALRRAVAAPKHEATPTERNEPRRRRSRARLPRRSR